MSEPDFHKNGFLRINANIIAQPLQDVNACDADYPIKSGILRHFL
jgi:hypothetical protein